MGIARRPFMPFVLAAIVLAAQSASLAAMTHADRTRVAEARRLVDELGELAWPGWSAVKPES